MFTIRETGGGLKVKKMKSNREMADALLAVPIEPVVVGQVLSFRKPSMRSGLTNKERQMVPVAEGKIMVAMTKDYPSATDFKKEMF